MANIRPRCRPGPARFDRWHDRVAPIDSACRLWRGMVPAVTCVFCSRLSSGPFIAENGLAVAFLDAFPLNPGHCLLIPRRHEADFLGLTEEEQAAIWALVAPVCRHIEAGGMPDGYNIGVNVGEAAGQTVNHAHLHVIPRHQGDVVDPRGGIRCVIPERARYWEAR